MKKEEVENCFAERGWVFCGVDDFLNKTKRFKKLNKKALKVGKLKNAKI